VKPSEVLRAARKLIERPGSWCQKVRVCGEYGEHPTQYCSEAALDHAPGGGIDKNATVRARECFVEAVSLPAWWAVAEWNDQPNRTHPEVLAAFDRAIALAESEGQ
jgi:hypothetical protein